MSKFRMYSFLVASLALVSALILASCNSGSGGNFTLKGATSSTGLAAVFASNNASSLKVKLYKFAVSTNVDCSSPVTVYTNDDPDYQEMTGQATFGQSEVADGTYPCVILEMSDIIKFTPTGSASPCVDGTEVTYDICKGGNDDGTSMLVDGTSVTCTGDSENPLENKVAIYLTTISTHQDNGGSSGSHLPPAVGATTSDNGLKLDSALVVSGDKTAYFIIDPTDKVGEENGHCGLDAPSFSFSAP
jgi:hypothetical protein